MCVTYAHAMNLRFLRIASLLAISSAFSVAACGGATIGSVGTENPAEDEEDFGEELRTKTDAAVQAEIAAAAKGTVYVSESDNTFTLVKASLPDGTRAITEAIVRDKLAWYVDHDENADKPLAKLNMATKTWASWKSESDPKECGTPGSYPGPEECAKVRALNDVLGRNLRGIKVYYFGANGSPGHVDGVAVSILIVGRTPKGNLAGVRTLAIWT